MTDKIINQLIELEIIEREEAEIYRFGLEALILKTIHYISYLFIAIFCKEVLRFLTFFVAFLLLRKSAGGYHANTKIGCYIASCSTVISVIALLKFIVLSEPIIIGGIILMVVADCLILWLAPLGNKNRELDEEEIKFFRKRSISILMVENTLALLLVHLHTEEYAFPVALAIICQAVLLVLQKVKR